MKKTMTMLAVVAVGFSMLGAGAAFAGPKKSSSKVISGQLNLNTATAAQLDMMPGVGPKAADRIIAYRAKTPFTRPEELVKVKGFGKKKLEKLKGHLTVSGPTTLKVTTSDGAEHEAAALPAAQGRGAPTAATKR